jgi:hypothetical protein
MTHPALANPFSEIMLQGAVRIVSKPDGNRTPCVLSGRQPPSICRGERRPTRLGEQQTDYAGGGREAALESAVGVTAGETAPRFQPDLAALSVELDPPPLFLRGPRPTFVPRDDGRSLLAILRVVFGVTP